MYRKGTRIGFIVLLALLLDMGVRAQELKCNVQIVTQQIQGTNKLVFQTLQTAIYEFMNMPTLPPFIILSKAFFR